MIHARKDYDRIQDPEGLIPEDEPVFLIRGQDIVGPEVLRYWADLHVANGGEQNLAAAVDEHATLMEKWQAEHKKKVADAPEEVLR
ncbi:MAG: hypothetical protein GY906_36995 [bacterium]|nr:hypothetical protein [bacterium]